MYKILVTGSKGVVGSLLTKRLEEHGHEVYGIDLFHAPGEIGWDYLMVDKFIWTYARADISEYRHLERVFRSVKFDFVFNCAAEFGRWNGEDYYENVWKTNVIGLKHLLKLQRKYKFKMIHFSSSEVYGDYSDIMKENVMDNFEIKQLNDYALSKWTNEIQIRNSALIDGTSTVIVRLFNTYGVGELYHPYRSVNSKFCYHALHTLPIVVHRGHKRSSTYISDAVDAISNIVDNFIPGRIYNIGSDELHTIEDLIEIIKKEVDINEDLLTYRDSEILTTKIKIPDIELSKKELGYEQTVNLEKGVKLTLDWMKTVYRK